MKEFRLKSKKNEETGGGVSHERKKHSKGNLDESEN